MVGKEFYNIKNDSDENAWKFYEDFYSEKLDKSKKTLDIKGKNMMYQEMYGLIYGLNQIISLHYWAVLLKMI